MKRIFKTLLATGLLFSPATLWPQVVPLRVGEVPLFPEGWEAARADVGRVHPGGTRFYVDGQLGDDANPGDSDHPWRTIQKAAETLQAGQTGLIRSGVYHEVIYFKNTGTPGLPIILGAADGAVVVIDGRNQLPGKHWEGLVVIDKKAYIDVVGLNLINSSFAGVFCEKSQHLVVQGVKTDHTWSSGLQFWSCNNVDLWGNDVRRACEGKDKQGEGSQECITLADCEDFDVRYNHVWDRLVDTGNGGEGIDTKQACRNGTVHHNLVHDLVRLGIYVDAYDRNLRDVKVSSNVVFGCESGIVVSAEMKSGQASHIRIDDNIVFGNRENGISVSDFVNDAPRRGILIDLNTVVGNGTSHWGGGIFVATRNPQSRDITISRNVVSQNGAWQIAVQTPTLRRVAVLDNLLDGYRGYGGGKNAEQEVQGTDPILAEAGFVDAGAFDFRLREDSPVRKLGWGAVAQKPPSSQSP